MATSPYWQMSGILQSDVEDYLYKLLPERHVMLREMEAYAAEHKVPIVGPLVGRYLFQLATIAGARRIFEMGSAIGYSTLWWAMAVGEGGKVIYTDSDHKNAARAKDSLHRAGLLDRVQIETGDAIELLSEQKGEFDIVFNDIDKPQYPQAFRMATAKVRKGGLYVADNALWGGKIARSQEDADEKTRAILEHNRLLYEKKDFFPTIIPLRDGVAVAVKQ